MTRAVRWLVGAVLIAALLLTGCWDRIELSDQDVIAGVAFDAAPHNGIRVTVSIIRPQNLPQAGGASGGGGGGSSGESSTVVSASGTTIVDAVQALGQGLPGHLFWGHTRIIVIGGALAQRGIQPVLDFFLRHRTARLATDMVVTRGEAGHLLTINAPYRTPATDVLYEHLRRRTDVRAPAYEVAASLLTRSGSVLIPEVVPAQPHPPGNASGGGSGGAGASGSRLTTPETFLFGGAGIFEEGRLRAWLSPRGMRGAMWLLGTVRHAQVSLDAPGGAVLTVRMEKVTIRRRALMLPQGVPGVEVSVDASAEIAQVEQGHPPLHAPDYLLQLSRALDRTIRGYADRALASARANDADFLQLGRLVAADVPGAWRHMYREWPAAFPRLPVIVNVTTRVQTTGNLVTLG
jgi:spore germination protein KC